MDRRIKLGIPFDYDTKWIAGAYYIVNIIKALDLLKDDQKPAITIFFKTDNLLYLIKDIKYPFITFVEQNVNGNKIFLVRIINKLIRFFSNKNIIETRLKEDQIDYLFPASNAYFFSLIPEYKRKYWIPDFQEHFLPELFSESEINARVMQQNNLVSINSDIVFSSYDSQSNFYSIYPNARNKTYVIQFAVFHNDGYKNILLSKLHSKYNLPQEYFFCANQFWSHKNHITIFKALVNLKKRGISKKVVFSGAQIDNRNVSFFSELMAFVEQNGIAENVLVLGFIDRDEQLRLMLDSIAIIQPSLFEGWSTVVEDAKALNKPIILSDILVHREQIDQNVVFFEPKNDEQLADIINEFNIKVYPLDYNQKKEKFAEDIIKIFK